MKFSCAFFQLLLLPLALHAANEDESSDLFGRIVSESGPPIAKATVFIYTAGPKKGTASLCPSCYPDCRKKAQTDADGQFKIDSVDPKLIFRLLVVAGGHEARFVPNVDPEHGRTEIAMRPIDPLNTQFGSRAAGIVIGPDGHPVVGAVLNVEGIERANSTRWGGNEKDADPVAVADDRGRFVLGCKDDINVIHLLAEGRGVAKRWVELRPGRDHLVRMQEGATITGQIQRQGHTLSNVVVGLITTERMAGVCLHDFETVSGEDGRFALTGVTPDNSYYLFAHMESLRDQGTLPVKTVKVGATGTMVELGKLDVEPAHRIKGQIVLTDGHPIPPNTRLLLGRDQAWDHTDVALDENGGFEFLGVPTESVSLYARINGYKFSRTNPSLDWLNGGIIGRVDRDIPDLKLVMEPGQWRFSRGEESDMPPEGDRQPRDKPLRSAVEKPAR